MNGMDLLDKSGYAIKRFSELDLPYQMALVWYMAFDGEAWETIDYDSSAVFDPDVAKESIKVAMPKYVARHGATLFGLSTFSVEDFKTAVMTTAEINEDFDAWHGYQDWYTAESDIPVHGAVDRWPVIVSGFDDEVLQDGWHRAHSYILSGHADLPVVFYPEPKHLGTSLVSEDAASKSLTTEDVVMKSRQSKGLDAMMAATADMGLYEVELQGVPQRTKRKKA